MNARNTANSIWAVVKLGAASDALWSLIPRLASRVPAVSLEMNAQDVSNVTWAVGKTKSQYLLGLLPALEERVPAVMFEMIDQAVSNVIWGHRTAVG